MVQLHPFKGYHYNPSHPELTDESGNVDLGTLITQPYDKIPDDLQDEYYERSPYNFVRLILNKGTSEGDLPPDEYEQANVLLDRWDEDEILVQSEESSMYLHETRFVDGKGNERRRLGFYSLAELESFGEGSVHAHEHTMSGPKADRLNLLRATRANLEPIFFLYEDEQESELQSILNQKTEENDPDQYARINNSEEHRVWTISDQNTVETIQRQMQDRQVVIADGHHRYETALNYHRELKEQNDPAAEEAGKRMGVFISAEDPGLYIFPSHRVVGNLDQFHYKELKSSLSRQFDLKVYSTDFDEPEFVNRQKQAFLEDVRFDGIDEHAFGAVPTGEDELLLFKIKPEDLPEGLFPDNRSETWCSLDVNILSKLVLERELGITPEDVEAGSHISYHRHVEEVFDQIQNNEAQIGFIMNPTGVQEVLDVASAGERMPQKSTDFYPKLPSGLIFRRLTHE